jgi:hypothetical protein
VSEFDNSQWTVDQTLRWLIEGGPGRTPRFATREAALANVQVQLSDGTLHMSGRPCRWEKGNIAEQGRRQQIDGLQVIDLEFIAVPNTADYCLAPQGLRPFEANYSDTGYDDGTGAVHPPLFSGWCELRLRRSEIFATWPVSSAHKGQADGPEREGSRSTKEQGGGSAAAISSRQAEPRYSEFYKPPEQGESRHARKVRVRNIGRSVRSACPNALQSDVAAMVAYKEPGRTPGAFIKMLHGWENLK